MNNLVEIGLLLDDWVEVRLNPVVRPLPPGGSGKGKAHHLLPSRFPIRAGRRRAVPWHLMQKPASRMPTLL